MIKIYEPYRISNSINNLVKVIESSKITCQNDEFEFLAQKLSNIHDRPVIPVFNGTCATHLSFLALRHKIPSIRNIIVPNNVYVAAWNSMLMSGHINLIPVDADDKTWCIDLEILRQTIRNSDPNETGILIVHNIGNIVNVPKLIREFPDHLFIEDNCEGFLGEYEGKKSGTASLASSISFYANKTITCGEGGALIIKPELYDYFLRVQSQGQTQQRYIHDILAFNYRMTNIQATILLDQIEIIDEIIEKKKIIFERYKKDLSKKFEFQISEENTKHSNWMLALRIRGFNYHKDYKVLNSKFETRPMFYPMSSHKHLSEFVGDEKIAKLLANECFMIPSHPNLQESELDTIIESLNKIVD